MMGSRQTSPVCVLQIGDVLVFLRAVSKPVPCPRARHCLRFLTMKWIWFSQPAVISQVSNSLPQALTTAMRCPPVLEAGRARSRCRQSWSLARTVFPAWGVLPSPSLWAPSGLSSWRTPVLSGHLAVMMSVIVVAFRKALSASAGAPDPIASWLWLRAALPAGPCPQRRHDRCPEAAPQADVLRP